MFNSFISKLYVQKPQQESKRHLWAWLNVIFNMVSDSRIKEVGGERACAEWLIRNGASVIFNGDPPTKDYNLLASLPMAIQPKIVGIDASEATITHHGFRHFKYCNHLESIRFHKCWYLSDQAMPQLEFVKGSLSRLHISECGLITDPGILALGKLSNLKHLTLSNLGVRDWRGCEAKLRKALPHCQMKFNQVDEKRISEVGPDRACAEWILRNGGSVTFRGDIPTKDFYVLTRMMLDYTPQLIEIDASETSITHQGFSHLKNCKFVGRIRLHKCYYLEDRALPFLLHVRNSLTRLEISECRYISAAGLEAIKDLSNLGELILYKLKKIKDWKKLENDLRAALPNTNLRINEDIFIK